MDELVRDVGRQLAFGQLMPGNGLGLEAEERRQREIVRSFLRCLRVFERHRRASLGATSNSLKLNGLFSVAHYAASPVSTPVRLMILAVFAVSLVGCAGDDDEPEAVQPPTTSSTTTSTTPTATTPTETLGELTSGPVTAPADGDEISLLERVAFGQHPDYDRVVFQFRNGLPGYRIEYVEAPLHADGSGDVVPVDGEAFLVVRMEPASGFDLATGEGELVYTGPRRLGGGRVVREIVRIGDFEAVVTWAIGVDEQRDFRVLRLENPARLVIDVPTD